jgi:hypothetical protein
MMLMIFVHNICQNGIEPVYKRLIKGVTKANAYVKVRYDSRSLLPNECLSNLQVVLCPVPGSVWAARV